MFERSRPFIGVHSLRPNFVKTQSRKFGLNTPTLMPYSTDRNTQPEQTFTTKEIV